MTCLLNTYGHITNITNLLKYLIGDEKHLKSSEDDRLDDQSGNKINIYFLLCS